MKEQIKLLTIILVLLTGQITNGQSHCSVNLHNTGTHYILKPEIGPNCSGRVSPYSLIAHTSVFLPCRFFYDSSHWAFAAILYKKYTFKKGNEIVAEGISKGPFWDKQINDRIQLVESGDSLIIDSIVAVVTIADSIIDLTHRDNIQVSAIRMQFSSAIKQLSNDELLFEKTIKNVQTFRKLIDLYTSSARIDNSVAIDSFEHSPSLKIIKRRYQFMFGERTDYDFTFIQDKRGHIEKVYDHVHKKEYTLKQWESRMKKEKL